MKLEKTCSLLWGTNGTSLYAVPVILNVAVAAVLNRFDLNVEITIVKGGTTTIRGTHDFGHLLNLTICLLFCVLGMWFCATFSFGIRFSSFEEIVSGHIYQCRGISHTRLRRIIVEYT